MATKTAASYASTTQNEEPDENNHTQTPPATAAVEVAPLIEGVRITVDSSVKHFFTGDEAPYDEPNVTRVNPIIGGSGPTPPDPPPDEETELVSIDPTTFSKADEYVTATVTWTGADPTQVYAVGAGPDGYDSSHDITVTGEGVGTADMGQGMWYAAAAGEYEVGLALDYEPCSNTMPVTLTD